MENKSLVTIENVRGYIGEGNMAYLNLEDVARGLGFEKIETKNGKEYRSIRWSRINTYLASEGFDQKWSKDSYIPENAFYSLCMIADSEIAKKFRRLVCDEILPQIRQTGGYIHTEEHDTDEDIMAKALIIAQKTIERKSQRIKELEVKVEEDKPKVEYYNEVLHSDKLMPVTLIAKDLGMSAIKLNKILNELDIQYKVRNSWVLTAKYQHFVPELADYIINDYGQSLQWTEKGREWIITKVKEYLDK